MAYLHYFRNRTCFHCNSTCDQEVLHATPEVTKTEDFGTVRWEESTERFRALIRCRICGQGSLYRLNKLNPKKSYAFGFLNRLVPIDVFRDNGVGNGVGRHLVIQQGHKYGVELNDEFQIITVYPESVIKRPGHDELSPTMREAYDELEGVMSIPRMTSIACRRILEITCREKLESMEIEAKSSLAGRIGQLQGAGLITKEVAVWSKALKNILNGDVHEGKAPTHKEAQELISLTNTIVELIYTLPNKINKMKADAVGGE